MFTFLNSWYLIGLLSALIPLVIHLSQSKRTRTMRFSTTMFFTEQFLRSYHMSRVKELLLLAMRMALCALLALALARPLIMPKGSSFFSGSSGSRAVVFVLDNSASMGYAEQPGGPTLLDKARGVARDLLQELKTGDTAAVVLAGSRDAGPELLFTQPTADLNDVEQALNSVRPTALATDYRPALDKAEQLVRSAPATSKEVYLLGDLQESGWRPEGADEPTPSGSDALHFVVRVRPEAVSNLAVTSVQYAAARPMIGVPFSIRPQINAVGDVPATADVRLFVNNAEGKAVEVARKTAERQPNGRWSAPRFNHTFAGEGWHTGYVEVSGDTHTADNRRSFAFEVLSSIDVLAVDGAPSQVARLDELFFLKAALTADLGERGRSPVRVETTAPAAVAGADLGKYALVILANVEKLTEPAVEKLEQYVDRGGSLLVFLGDKVNADFYNSQLAAKARLHGGLLPGSLRGRVKTPAGKPASVAAVDTNHEALAPFQDSKFASLSAVTVDEYWKLDVPGDAVLMRADGGDALLAERPFGKGRVVLFASTCDRDWTNFPVRLAYLPWTYRLVSYLAQKPLGREGFFVAGEAVPVPAAGTEAAPRVSVTLPDGSAGAATVDAQTGQLAFTDTAQAGVYTMTISTDNGKPPVTIPFVVNEDGNESNLSYLDETVDAAGDAGKARMEAELKKLLPGRPLITYVADPARAVDESLGARRGIRLWDWFLFIVLVLALIEPWLANRLSLLYYSRSSALPAGTTAGPSAKGRWARPMPEPTPTTPPAPAAEEAVR